MDLTVRTNNEALRVLLEVKFVDAAPAWLAPPLLEHLRPAPDLVLEVRRGDVAGPWRTRHGGIPVGDDDSDDPEEISHVGR